MCAGRRNAHACVRVKPDLPFPTGEEADFAPFAKVALRVLKCLPSTVLVDARFSLVSLMKSKHRTHLDIKKLRGTLVMKDELPVQ